MASSWGFKRRPRIEAAASVGLTPSAGYLGYGTPSGWGTGIRTLQTADFPAPPVAGVLDRVTALSIPAVSRGRDLLCSAIASLPLVQLRMSWVEDRHVEQQLPPATWMLRPDPNRTRAHILAWTTDDLIFYSRAYWRVTNRYATGYPSAFERLVPTEVNVDSNGRVTYRGQYVPADDIVEFSSFTDSILVTGARSLNTSLRLEEAAERFATTELPSGVLRQTGGEPLSSKELGEMADNFTARRRVNSTAALGLDVSYEEMSSDPERMQLIEARGYQDLEASRLLNVPPFAIGAPAGTSMTYQNAEQARRDLIDFGALPFINCIEQTLSGPNVTPAQQFVRLDLSAWLRNPFAEGEAKPNDAEIVVQDTPPLPTQEDASDA